MSFLLVGCCGCCSALRPRYKRLVDNVFPDNPQVYILILTFPFYYYYYFRFKIVFFSSLNCQDGLVKNNLEKLTFYASSSPEKLDRIGDYLAQKTARDLSRHRME